MAQAADGAPTIRFVELRPMEGAIQLALYEHFVPADDPFIVDVYGFDSVAEHQGEPIEELEAPTAATALRLAEAQWGACPGRYVNQGVVQDEYLDYIEGRRPSA